MHSQIPIRARSQNLPASYRMMRGGIRFGLRLFSRRLRLLNRERIERPGPAILLITHPRSLATALYLISALDRQVHCLLPSCEVQGLFGRLAAWALGIRPFDSTHEEQGSPLKPCLSILANQGAIALFAEQAPQNGAHRAPLANFAARLTVEAILEGQAQVPPTLYPVHWFFRAGFRSPTPVMDVDRPIQAQEFLPKVAENLAVASRDLIHAVRTAISENIFGMAEPELGLFSQELEDLSREQLEQEWSRRPNWKQRPEELQLSGIARKWIAEQNRTDPARLVELRESLDAYREARRHCSMGELIIETAGPWQASRPSVAAAWFETVLGFPVALYGLINHLLALGIFKAGGLFRNSHTRDPKVEWLLRISAVLGSYTVQIFVVHFWWGRAVAGYYALTLPVSGAYLWRYRWLLRHRADVLIRKALHPFRSARVSRARKDILGSFNRELEYAAQSSGPDD